MAITADDRRRILEEGAAILQPILAPHGFTFAVEHVGKGSGGHFASGAFVRGNRRLELHFRWSLGLVTYAVGDAVVGHDDLMWVVVPAGERAEYPGYGDDPLSGFRQLKADLLRFGDVFVSGSEAGFAAAAKRALERPKGFGAIR